VNTAGAALVVVAAAAGAAVVGSPIAVAGRDVEDVAAGRGRAAERAAEEQAPAARAQTATSTPTGRRSATAAYSTDVPGPDLRARLVVPLLVVGALLAACGGGSSAAVRVRPGPSSAPPASPVPEQATAAPYASAVPPATAPPTTARRPPTTPGVRPDRAAPGAPAVPAALSAVGPATQAVIVSAPSYGSTTATLSAWSRTAGGWQRVLGPWPAHVGYAGVAPPGRKAEGDGRTPSGTFGLSFFFGVDPDPGVRFQYRRVTSSIVWDDDPASPLYNEWVDTATTGAGADPEPMYQPGPYRYGAVIAYNTARVPGAGSAIFLHVSTGGATAGCVSIPAPQLLDVLRWLDPAAGPRVAVGVGL
jgi:L,D-peptidoglycan transpeptidase YkuD (ErfK/YbiS/YcfS/YnhG family)